MKILFYALNYAPEPIGVGRYTGDIGAYFAGQGHAVSVITAVPHYPEWKVAAPFSPYRYTREQRNGAKVTRCPLFLRRPMRGLWRLLAPCSFAVTSLPVLAWSILRHRPDIVFCVEPTVFAAPAALLFSALVGARTVLHVQDLEIDAAFAVGHLKSARLRLAAVAAESFLMRRFGRIITISQRMRDFVVAKGVDSARIALVRNWVDLDAIRPIEGANRFREEFGWSEALHVALYAGSIGAKQALNVALDAAERLSARSDILFVIAGDGPAKAGLIERYGHLANVHFLPPQPEGRMCDLLNLADIHLLPQTRGIADLVLPSKLGGMLASGKPVLVTADQGTELHEVLNGVAIIVPAGDGEAIARELAMFADRGRHHPQMGDGRRLLDAMSARTCLEQIAASVLAATL